jgi:hypothetical protein
VQVLQEVNEVGRDTIGAKNPPQGIAIDIVVSLSEVNEG